MTKTYKIAIIALAAGVNKNPIRLKGVLEGIKYLQKLGNVVVVGGSVKLSSEQKNATKQEKLDDLNNFFADDSIDIILNLTGGYDSNELLELVDFDLYKNNPKKFVGYSDITTFNMALYSKSNIKTINGCMLVDYTFDKSSLDRILGFIESKPDIQNFDFFYSNVEKLSTPEIVCLSGKNEFCIGNVVVANLSTFNLLLGTGYLPDLDGFILFLEYDKEEQSSLFAIRRMLWQIRQNKIFDKINGLVFGLLEKEVQKEEREFDLTLDRILTEVTKGFDFPTIYNLQFGHIYPSLIFQNGEKILIEGNKLTRI
jgi:muramoyltetrapeptide carboxypeptidase